MLQSVSTCVPSSICDFLRRSGTLLLLLFLQEKTDVTLTEEFQSDVDFELVLKMESTIISSKETHY